MGLVTKTIRLEGDQKVYFISDTHYNHKNICRGTTTWKLKDHGGHDSVRDFDTLAEMNDKIVNDINSVVGPDDWLIHLGDWSFGGIQSTWEFRNRLVCKNVVLVLGNHDEQIDANKLLPNAEKSFGKIYTKLGPGYATTDDVKEDVYAQDIFESVYGRLQLTVKRPDGSKSTYECNHFPWAIWNKGHHGRMQVYGHVHGGYNAGDRSIDAGIDNIRKLKNNFVPLSEKEIAKYMQGREYIQMSHHNKNTN